MGDKNLVFRSAGVCHCTGVPCLSYGDRLYPWVVFRDVIQTRTIPQLMILVRRISLSPLQKMSVRTATPTRHGLHQAHFTTVKQ